MSSELRSENGYVPRLLTVQDISCLGKCSLTVALPVISALGVEAAVLPTALLSTHTMLPGFSFLDLTDQMEKIIRHWEKEEITFDTIYAGYLGSVRQMEIVRSLKDRFHTASGERPRILIDPVMADHGRLYAGFDPSYVQENARFCACADVILPNLTEAAFLTGLPYQEHYGRDYIVSMLKALCRLGPGAVVLTGVSYREGRTGVSAMDRESGKIFEYFTDRVPAGYHGTGDLFASVVAGMLTRGSSLEDALKLAVDYTQKTIAVTYGRGVKDVNGVDFESTLPELTEVSRKL